MLKKLPVLCPTLPVQKSEADRAEARVRSAASVVNIDPQERTRRVTLGLSLVVSLTTQNALSRSPAAGLPTPPPASQPIG